MVLIPSTRGIEILDVQGKSLTATLLINQLGIKGLFYYFTNANRNKNWGTVGIFRFSSQTLEMFHFIKYEKNAKYFSKWAEKFEKSYGAPFCIQIIDR